MGNSKWQDNALKSAVERKIQCTVDNVTIDLIRSIDPGFKRENVRKFVKGFTGGQSKFLNTMLQESIKEAVKSKKLTPETIKKYY